MIQEACRQFMERKQAECEGKEACPEKRQEKEATKEKEKAATATSNNEAKDTEAAGKKKEGSRPWDRWQAWQQSLQQIYAGDDSNSDGFELIDDEDHPHPPPPPPMWGYGWGRGMGRGMGRGFGRGRWARMMNRMGPEAPIPCNTGYEDSEAHQGDADAEQMASAATGGETQQSTTEKGQQQ